MMSSPEGWRRLDSGEYCTSKTLQLYLVHTSLPVAEIVEM
jgi:hypothetical protein